MEEKYINIGKKI